MSERSTDSGLGQSGGVLSGASVTPSDRRNDPQQLLVPSSARDPSWALDPAEHAWMLLSVDGSFETLAGFLSADPRLLTRRDVISGYSVLHWLAKRGRGETLARVLRHAHSAGVPVDVDVRGSGGLTPLHVAAMHGHFLVIKLLVGAFGADVDVMDHGGRRAWRYLKDDAPAEMKELLGTGGPGEEVRRHPDHPRTRTQRRSWRFGSVRKLLLPPPPPSSSGTTSLTFIHK